MKLSKIHSNYKTAQWLLFTIACLLYVNTIPNKWAIDDGIIIHQNKFVQKGIKGIPEIVSKDAFSGFYGENMNAVEGGRYRPVSQVFFALNTTFFAKEIENEKAIHTTKIGTKNLSETTWFPNLLHFFNMVWYGLLCMVIYRTLVLLFTKNNGQNIPKTYWVAFITSLLFTLHPLHTEVVANVKGLDEILALLGSVFALYSILKQYYSKNNQSKMKWAVVALVCFTLALFSKESAITFMVVIPLALFVFTEASGKTIFKLSAPLLLSILIFLGVRQSVLPDSEATKAPKELLNDPFLVYNSNATYEAFFPNSTLKKLKNFDQNTLQKMPKSNEIATNFYTYSIYLKLLFAPYPLTVDYYPRHIEIKSFASPIVLFSVLAHLFLLIWALKNIRNRNWIAFGILYYFITFSIVSNFFFSIGTNMAERFMFMPSLGFCLIVATLLFQLVDFWNKKQANLGYTRITMVLVFITIVFGYLTVNRNFDWKDNMTLFSKDILVSSNSAKINFDLAALILEESIQLLNEKNKEAENFSTDEKDKAIAELDAVRNNILQQAITLLEKSVTIHPLYTVAWLKLGNAYQYLGQLKSNTKEENKKYLEKAQAAYELVVKMQGNKTSHIASQYIGICWTDYGKLLGQQFGDIKKAIQYLEKAKKQIPNDAQPYFLLGTAYSIDGNINLAISNTEKAFQLAPNDLDVKQNLAVAYQIAGFNEASKRDLLPKAEKLLMEILDVRKQKGYSQNSILQTLDLLYKNATIQNDIDKQSKYKAEILQINPNAFSNNQ
jgi:protein O-mannosyl-transferase